MSIQGILAKEYMPDLSLVGSHVAALQPLAYTASTSKCCSAFGSINQRHAILPSISRISRSPEQKLAHRSLSEYSSTHSLIGSIEMPPGGLDTLFQSTQRLVSSPPHDPNTCPNEELADKGTEPSVQPQCWRSSKSSPDDSLLSQAMKLEQFNLSSQQPNHILHSLPNQQMPPHQVNVIHSDGSERRSTWHAELLTESNKKTSKDELAEEQNKELQNENNNSNRTSSTKNKHKKGKRKKKKKSHRSASNKANWAKVRSKSAGRPWQPLSGKASATGSNHDDNNGPMIMAHCKAISVLPLPRHLSKPNVIAPLGNRVNHQATPRSHRSTMGTMASVPMSGKSNLHPGHVRVMMPKSVEGLWPGGMKSDMTSVENVRRVVKVFCSDKHSGMLKELGMEVPCAPPATPTPAMLSKFEYIPSMNDVRSQRAVKIRLETLEKLEKKKQEKLKIEKSRQEKQEMKEKEKELKKRQRLEIYALNKVMTEFENANFEEFCKKHGLNLK